MHGLMMEQQLLISGIIDHAARYHSDGEVISVNTNGGETRTNYAEIQARALQLSSALAKRGMNKSDRIATIAWNNHRHLELYYAIPGAGLVCHTLNPRLFPEQFIYIINHAEDRIIFFDQTFLPLVDALRDKLTCVELFVLMEPHNEELAAAHPWMAFYEDFLATGDENASWSADLDEKDASSLCYTSGTTGNPKGALYSHRSTLLHTIMSATPDVMNLSACDSVLPVVPMFHVNAWGIAYSAPLVGAKLVMPGPGLDGKSLVGLLNREKVSFSAGVPTIWSGLLQHLSDTNTKLPHMDRTVIGGSACPPSMIDTFRDDYDVDVIHAWGMTELSPLGSVNNLKYKHLSLSKEEQNALRINQGRPPIGIELGVFDEEANQLPNDGIAQGDLYCRGPWVISEYFSGEGGNPLVDGWFPTGDVAVIDADGNMTIRDRSKDIIKSGGEWISSVELEGLAMAHPDIADAAVIAARHAKWEERPLLIVVPVEGKTVTTEDMQKFYEGKVAKWWIPDAVQITDEIPRNATGKIRKNLLRESFGDVLMK